MTTPTHPTEDAGAPTPGTGAEVPRRLSPARVAVAALAVVGLALGGAAVVRHLVASTARGAPTAWFAPYVDATLVPTHPFEQPMAGTSGDVVLGFVVAEGPTVCAPTWGTYVDLDGAARSFDMDRRILRLRAEGGEPVVSFGGVVNTELAVACPTVDALAAAYGSVVDRYHLATIDLDIEGAALVDVAANRRRGEAVARLQRQAQAAGRQLDVWLTLPVGLEGLPADALGVVDATLAAGVDLAGVNAMVMNYGAGRPASVPMAEANAMALTAVHEQLVGAFRRHGHRLTADEVWRRVGATPMIGQNDERTDVFTLDDASDLIRFARRNGLGRVSMWSANRDAPCGPQLSSSLVSNTCSGQQERPGEFAEVLDGLTGRAATDDGAELEDLSGRAVAGAAPDDARTSPYPIWREERPYAAGAKVVWQANVYEAKWWTRNDRPDEPVAEEWETPWRYLGPVLPSDRPAPRVDLPGAAYDEWTPTGVYVLGDRVVFEGMVYEAKWYTVGDRPDPDRPWQTAWEPVTDPTVSLEGPDPAPEASSAGAAPDVGERVDPPTA